MTAPHRQRKHDRLTYSGAKQSEIECDFALGPLDRVAVEMDRKWGVDRLVELQTPEVARKYGARMAELNAAVAADDPAAVAATAAILIANLRRMDELATAAGHKPLTPDLWEFELNGRVVAIMRETGDWRAAQAMRPGVTIYSMREVAIALEAKADWVDRIKATFPGAAITAVRETTELEAALDDEIPF